MNMGFLWSKQNSWEASTVVKIPGSSLEQHFGPAKIPRGRNEIIEERVNKKSFVIKDDKGIYINVIEIS